MSFGNDQARDALIRTIWGEAGNQGPQGWLAVAHVIKNRIDSGAWGPNDHVLPVLYAKHQFSMYNEGNPQGPRARALATNDPAYQRIGQVVDAVFSGKTQDPTGGATHFFNPKEVSEFPLWAADATNVRTIGDHVFMTVPLTMNSTGGTILPTYRAPGHDEEGSVNEADGPGGYDTQHMDPEFLARIAKLRDDAAAQGIRTRVLSGYRDTQKQEMLYENYMARKAGRPIPHPELGPGNVAAPPGGSYHNYGRAMDIEAIDANGNRDPVGQQKLIALADQQGRGITAGAHFKTTPDYDHFQAAEGARGTLNKIALGYVGPSTLEMSRGQPQPQPANVVTVPPNIDTSVYKPSPLGGAETAPLAKVNTTGTDTTLGGGDKAAPAAPPAASGYTGEGVAAPNAQTQPAGSVGASAAPAQNPRFPVMEFGANQGGRAGPSPQYVSALNLADLIYGTPSSPATPAAAPAAALSSQKTTQPSTTLPPEVVANPPLPPINPFRSRLPASVLANPPLPPYPRPVA
jgi:hypothetical protein